MLDESSFLVEYLGETNKILAQIDYSHKLQDLVNPIRNFLLKQKELLSYSMARYCGSNTQLAFFCEWYFQILKLTSDTTALTEENRQYFSKKIPIKFRGVPNIYNLVEQDILVFVPQQLSLLQSKSKTILDQLAVQYPYLGKYLNEEFLSQIISSVYTSNKRKYAESLSLSEYLESQSTSVSFCQIGFPCLIGLCFYYNQENSPTDPATIKWVIIEEILKNISLLHQINQTRKFDEFVFASTLSEREEFEWMQLDSPNRTQRILGNTEIREQIKSHKNRIYSSALQQIDRLELQQTQVDLLRELLEWARMIPVG
jgi:hypothetical protein